MGGVNTDHHPRCAAHRSDVAVYREPRRSARPQLNAGRGIRSPTQQPSPLRQRHASHRQERSIGDPPRRAADGRAACGTVRSVTTYPCQHRISTYPRRRRSVLRSANLETRERQNPERAASYFAGLSNRREAVAQPLGRRGQFEARAELMTVDRPGQVPTAASWWRWSLVRL